MKPFYSVLYPRLLFYALRVLGPQLAYMAEDCVQEAVMNVYMRRSELKDVEQWRGWLLTAVRNNALMLIRRDDLSKRYAEHGMLSADEAEDVSLAMIEQNVYVEIFSIVASLPEKYKTVFELSFEQGLRNVEIAEMLNVAEITVKKRKAKLLDILREKLGRNVDERYIIFIVAAGSVFSDNMAG
ncbi:MAG: sigma-70 family RNA polymerase sigma factor [Paenibacillus sp.]|nr:sigma-70 family RNA polymerase sigma factor [Paenibacillus sp.]